MTLTINDTTMTSDQTRFASWHDDDLSVHLKTMIRLSIRIDP
jgi:hypothetical protein